MNDELLRHTVKLLERIAAALPEPPQPADWDRAIAFRWRRMNGRGRIEAIAHPHGIRLSDLRGIDEQKRRIDQNTRQFVAGHGANNVLLTGARGTGKSSLIKALLNQYAGKGLRVIEVDKNDLIDLSDIVEMAAGRRERFILFCDDLSFEAAEPGYKALKSVLDGSLASVPENVILYATSNRRHLMPEFFAENLETTHVGEEIHPGESVEEKISLSERFGLWLSFYPFDQDGYLDIARHWLRRFGLDATAIAAGREEALQWALERGSRSGRSAWQFARDYAGRRERG